MTAVGVRTGALRLLLGCLVAAALAQQHDTASSGAYRKLLLFDLSQDHDKPDAFLKLTFLPRETVELRTVALGFPTCEVRKCEGLPVTSGSFEGYTLVTYPLPRVGGGPFSITLSPVYGQDFDSSRWTFDELTSSLYFVKMHNLRRFAYRYPTEVPEEVSAYLQLGISDTLEAIAVSVPSGATWEEVRPGSTSDPPSVRIQDGIRYYPPTGKTSSHGWLDLKYVVKPSSWQVGIGEWALILIGAVAGLLSAMLGVGRDNEGESAKLKGAMFVTGGIYLFASAAWTWVSISLVGRGWNDTLLKWAEPTGVLVAAIVLRLVIDRKHGK